MTNFKQLFWQCPLKHRTTYTQKYSQTRL
jgi:hypothetical protein